MRGRVSALAVLALVPAAVSLVHAQPPAAQEPPTRAQPLNGMSDMELGARVGVTTGGRATPGGLRLGGVLLYQLSDIDWFEGSLDFTVGSSAAACFTDRMGELVCNHGPLSGRAGELSAGVRRFLQAPDTFTPYAFARLGVRIISFPDDEIIGLGIPLTAGAGVRAQVTELLTVGGSAALELGAAWLSRGLGAQPQLGLTVQLGAEFRLN